MSTNERTFPIMAEGDRKTRQHFERTTIPWAMIEPHEAQADLNHEQSLATLARRGGLSREEACATLEDRPWMPMGVPAAAKRLAELVEAWRPAMQRNQGRDGT